eukprot:Opistho-2@41042
MPSRSSTTGSPSTLTWRSATGQAPRCPDSQWASRLPCNYPRGCSGLNMTVHLVGPTPQMCGSSMCGLEVRHWTASTCRVRVTCASSGPASHIGRMPNAVPANAPHSGRAVVREGIAQPMLVLPAAPQIRQFSLPFPVHALGSFAETLHSILAPHRAISSVSEQIVVDLRSADDETNVRFTASVRASFSAPNDEIDRAIAHPPPVGILTCECDNPALTCQLRADIVCRMTQLNLMEAKRSKGANALKGRPGSTHALRLLRRQLVSGTASPAESTTSVGGVDILGNDGDRSSLTRRAANAIDVYRRLRALGDRDGAPAHAKG